MGASRVPGPHPPTTGPQSPANAKDSTASTSLRPNSISILWDQGVTPQLQKARERVSGEPLPDHLHNKAIQRRGLTLPPPPTNPRPLRYNAPGPHFPPRSPQRPRPRPASTSWSSTVPSKRGMPFNSRLTSPSQLWSPSPAARSPDHAAFQHTDP